MIKITAKKDYYHWFKLIWTLIPNKTIDSTSTAIAAKTTVMMRWTITLVITNPIVSSILSSIIGIIALAIVKLKRETGVRSVRASQGIWKEEYLSLYRFRYAETIVRDLLSKLNDLNLAAATKTGEELINIRIQELALSKLLVLNYGKSDFRLVLAHYHLG